MSSREGSGPPSKGSLGVNSAASFAEVKRKLDVNGISLEDVCAWTVTVLRQPLLSMEEVSELDRRSDAAAEKYGWHDLGEDGNPRGANEIARNIAYLMLRRGLSFKAAAYEYVASMERGCRKVADSHELDLAASELEAELIKSCC